MSKHLQNDVDQLHNSLMTLFGVVEQMIDKASRALCELQIDLAREVIESDILVDDSEVKIEEDCLKILALHQPVAADLRRITTVLKINSDLERIADLACNVAERAQCIHNRVDHRRRRTGRPRFPDGFDAGRRVGTGNFQNFRRECR